MAPSRARGLGGSQRLLTKSQSTPTMNVKRFLSREEKGFSPREETVWRGSPNSAVSSPKAPSCGSTSPGPLVVALPSLKSLKAPLPAGGGVAAPGASAGSASGVLRPVRATELLLEVGQMRHEDVEFFSDRLACLGPKDGEKIRRAFRTRAAELLATATVQNLERARSTFLVLHSVESEQEFDHWHLSDTWPTTAGTDATRWQCPTRAFEERIAHLAYKAVHNLPALAQCRTVTADLSPRGFIRAKVHEVVVAIILRWVETEPLAQLRKHAILLHELAENEASIMVVLEKRLVRRARQAFAPGRFESFLQIIFDLQDRGLEVLDGPGAPVVDMKSATRFAALQVALLDCMRVGLKIWPMSQVAQEFRGSVLQIMISRPDIKKNVTVAATDRIQHGLHAIRDLVLSRVDPKRVQEEFLQWGIVTKAMGEHGLLEFSEPIRMHIMSGPEEIGSMAFCAASVTPGAAEIPPEYLGHIQGMYERVREIWQTVMEVMVLIGEEGDVAAARELMSERIA